MSQIGNGWRSVSVMSRSNNFHVDACLDGMGLSLPLKGRRKLASGFDETVMSLGVINMLIRK